MPRKSEIILHWTAGMWLPTPYEKGHYHGGVEFYENPPFASYNKWNNYTDLLTEQCYLRNTKSIGLAVCCMSRATERDFGVYPLMTEQVDELCLAAAEVAVLKSIALVKIMTHAEAAIADGYFGERWDLAELKPGKISVAKAKATGDYLRGKIKVFMKDIKEKRRDIRKLHFENM